MPGIEENIELKLVDHSIAMKTRGNVQNSTNLFAREDFVSRLHQPDLVQVDQVKEKKSYLLKLSGCI